MSLAEKVQMPGGVPAAPAVDVAADRRGLAAVGLAIVVAIWGANFVIVKDAIARWPVWPFLALRFWIAALAFLPLLAWEARRRGVAAFPDRYTWSRGVIAGTALFLAFAFQTFGLRSTGAPQAAFLTSVYVVMVPLILVVVRRSLPTFVEIASAVLAVLGVMILHRVRPGAFGAGDGLLVACAFFYAAQIVIVGSYRRAARPVAFTAIQLLVVATAATVMLIPGAVAGELPGFDVRVLWAALFTGLLASAVAFLVQTWAQRSLTAPQAAVILTMEPVFATLTAVLFTGHQITHFTLLGGSVIITAVLWCHLGRR